MSPRVSVIVLGFGEEPELAACLNAAADGLGPEDELLLVDNGVPGLAERGRELPAVARILGEPINRGFAGGCNFGAAHATGEILVFLNSDAIVAPDGIQRLVAGLDDPLVGIASGSLRLADQPDRINSAGNPVTYVGITWAGGCGEPAADHAERVPVSGATGGFFAIRAALWTELGGFFDEYFAYHEDTDLSLRVQLRGLRVDYIPDAVALHDYEFSRNPAKMYLLERNRLLVVLTVFPAGVRRRVLPMVLLTEPLFLAMGVMQGWWRQKLRSWWWLARHGAVIRRIRGQAQQGRVVSDGQFAGLLSARIEPPMVAAPPGMGVLNKILAFYWRLFAPR